MKTTSLIVCISLALSTGAVAQQHSNTMLRVAIPSFESLDRNMDGRLSRSEAGFDSWLSSTFAVSDVDGDGFVSRAEYDTARRVGSEGASGAK